MSVTWNPWHGCHKLSAGCVNCYVYRTDLKYDKDSSVVSKTASFDLPVRRDRRREYKIPAGELVYTCFTSDFLVPDADGWRAEAWAMMAERSDLNFLFITKRIDRLGSCLPGDWGGGYDNVTIGCTAENQECADYRLPIFISAPIKHRIIVCEPLLSEINLEKYLKSGVIEQVVAGGESGNAARLCDYGWVLKLREQCRKRGVSFYFKQTGARFIKDGRVYNIERKYQHSQARRAGIDI